MADPAQATRPPRRRRLGRLLALVAAVGVFMALIRFSGLADRLLLFPTTHRVTTLGQARHVPGPGGTVEVFTRRSGPAEPAAYVLHFNGNASRAEADVDYFLPLWAGQPVELWAVNYPGFGGSTGPARLAGMAPAALAAYDELARVAAGRPILVSGSSIGTAVALAVAARRPVAGVLLLNPPPLQRLILGRHGWWNLWLLATPVAAAVPADLNALGTAPACTAPAVILQSERDEIVPLAYQQRVAQAYAGPTRVVLLAGADHNSDFDPPALAAIRPAVQWLLDQATAKR